MAHGDNSDFPCGGPSHCYLYPVDLFCLFGLLVSQPNFAHFKPIAYFVPKV